jgi:uncharacterized repeat protein (TIGR03837 family)
MPRMQCDVFCAVIDNFGDAGVCWRLARQWVEQEGMRVRLWIDDPARLARIVPEVDPAKEIQLAHGVEVRRWGDPIPAVEPGEIVIEAFACRLPPSFEAAMAARSRPPVWINLEYLSAEDWVAGVHGLASPHPCLPLTKYFFFPGFGPETGGVLAEHGLAARRDAFQTDTAARQALWTMLGLEAAPDALHLSLFSYDNPAAEGLLSACAAGSQQVLCLVPQGTAPSVAQGHAAPGLVRQDGALQVWQIPFVDQDVYDRLLWACDFNFVRGEDSFVRAQLAGRPMAWQIYPQAEDAHWPKLAAWEALYLADCPEPAAAAWRALSHGWNRRDRDTVAAAWTGLLPWRAVLQTHAGHWAGGLLGLPGLSSGLARFCRDKLK